MSHRFWILSGLIALALLAGAGVLHLIPRLGGTGRRVSDALCRVPALDLLIAYFTVAPLLVGPMVDGWRGLGAAIVGQLVALILWTVLHELAHPRARHGPRIFKVIHQRTAPWRNLLAVYWTAIVAPLFFLVRLAELIVYPPLTWLVGLPPYPGSDWVRVSRHKFQGLVGHDLIWCLYCDWMTGVWSLGSEMLRNVESFWCPIRFDSAKKCANCAVDFPDVEHGWVAADASMAEVQRTLEQHYPPGQRWRPWFGHPARLTVKGREVASTGAASAAKEAVAPAAGAAPTGTAEGSAD